jgi:hypothetical protein
VAQSDASLDHRGVPAVPAYCGLERAEGLPVIVIGTQLNLGQNRAYVTSFQAGCAGAWSTAS